MPQPGADQRGFLCYDDSTMSANSGSPRDFRQNSRVPLHASTSLQIDAFSEPISGYTGDISLGGMFVKMRDPPPVGTLLRFAIELEAPAGTVKGTAEVVWLRARALAPSQPAGAGVQFRFIEEDGEPLLRQAVEKALRDLPPEPQLEPPSRADSPSVVRAKPLVESPPSTAPARKLHRNSASKKNSLRHSKPTRSAKKRPEKANDKKTLGMPTESAKVILLVVLFLVMMVFFLRGLG